jgi:CHAD domain-containing protein
MQRRGKWIEIESPDEPVSQVARRAVEGRLETVWHYLASAADDVKNVDHVHQLRVATRRARAALQIFDALIPPRRGKWFGKRLKRLRRTAGTARDCDVLRQRLAGSLQSISAGEVGDAILQRVDDVRRDSEDPIRDAHAGLKKQFSRRADKLVAKIRFRGGPEQSEPSVQCAGRRALQPVADEFFAAGGVNLDDASALHQFRIQGKHLRYAMEVFAGAFRPGFRKNIYPLVEELQEKLGVFNDHANAHAQYQEWLSNTEDPRQRDLLTRLVEMEAGALNDNHREFVSWWTPQRAGGLRRQFWEELNSTSAA